MFKIGIIGMGRVYDYQIEAVKEIRDIQVSAVCDTDEGKKVKKPEKARFYKNFHKMIKEEKLDAVVISLPNILHYEVAKVC
ncbi:MAG TPA: gfo/Idh/MocA family oxidoreductase, partial [Persephonella sp.]|nr:gfo/Idh/MocA family oxidoreductase [Persephonella sp.]